MLRIKRLLAMLLIMLILPTFSAFSVFATSENSSDNTSQSQTETKKKSKKSSKKVKKVIKPETVGYSNYVNHLEKTIYKGKLGSFYSKDKTTFKVWSPLADSVKVCIYTKGTDGEDGSQMLSKTKMELNKKTGVWELTLSGDYKNKYYTYLVTVNDMTNEVVDPYAKAVGANGDRGMILNINTTDPKGWSKDKFERVDDATDAIIWEVNVRDFSASPNSGVDEKYRGKFLAFTQEGTVVDSVEGALPTCIDHLKELGVNYVQINPFYDFQSIDETDTVNPQYNWGYDPKNYNVPEGSYSTDPYNGITRIKECKKMIKALHDAGIGVIMDVVYNHTYYSKDSFLNMIVPDYYYRIDENGNWSNGSGCGNDTASEHIMFREFMKNSVVYWAEEYHIDGFRFDLMGLHDVKTMNYIRKSLDKLPDGEKIIMYGEAWELDTYCASDVKLANQSNLSKLSDRIGAFNDTIRDGLKGNVFDAKDKGFIQSGNNKSKVKSGIEGMSTAGTWGTLPSQCINYASCHDNLSLYDKLVASVYPDDGDFRKRREDLVAMNKLSAAITLTSQGVPFMMAGEEIGRSKFGDENSYKSPVEVNQIDWNDLNRFADLNEYYKGLIDIRQTVDFLSDSTGEIANSIKYIKGTDDGVIGYTINGSEDSNTKTFAAVFNGSDKETTVTLPDDVCIVWVLIADDTTAGIKKIKEISDYKITVKPHSCALLVNKSSFDKYKDIDKSSTVIVKYKNTDDDAVFYEQILKGKKGEEYTVTYPEHMLYEYNVTGVSGSKSGEFKSKTQQVTVNCKPYSGDYSSVTIHFVDEDGKNISNSVVMTNRVGQKYTTPEIASIDGYKLNLDKLPENGAGKYTKNDIEVIYRYSLDKDLENSDACIANIIYMSDSGEILDKKTYIGDKGSEIVVEYLDIPGYIYISDNAQGAAFDSTEKNIILNYEKQSKSKDIVVIVACAVLVAFVLLIIFLLIGKRKNGHNEPDLVDDLYIE